MESNTLQIIQPSNPLEVLNLIDTKTCEQFAHDMAALVREGHVDPIQVRVKISAWEKAFKSLKTAIEQEVATEAAKHGKAFEFMGAKCEWVPTFTQYDYSHCADPEWEEYDAAETSAANSRKERETFLKALKEPITMIDTRQGSGEVITVNPPTKTQKEGLKITIK
jgi:hypothetical protein